MIRRYENGEVALHSDTLKRIGEILHFQVEIGITADSTHPEKKIHYTEEEFAQLVEKNLVNATDKVMLRLIFDIGFGKIEEILTLKVADVDMDNHTITIHNNGGSRVGHLSATCISYIKEALNEKEYKEPPVKSKNGSVSTTPLTNHDYLIKGNVATDKPISLPMYYHRMNNIKTGLKREYFTQNAIRQSGMLYMGKCLLERDGKLEEKQIQEIAEGYGLRTYLKEPKIEVIKEVVNLARISELYQ